MATELREMECSSCGKMTTHKKKRYRGKTIWKCQECYSVNPISGSIEKS